MYSWKRSTLLYLFVTQSWKVKKCAFRNFLTFVGGFFGFAICNTYNIKATAKLHYCIEFTNCFCSCSVSLPPDQVSQGVRKSKSLPLSSLGRSLAGLPPPVTSKSHRPGIHQSQSLCSFPAPLSTEPLRNMQVLPAIPPQRKRSPSPPKFQKTTENNTNRRT